jgi:outer membrane protein TolC
VEKAKIQLSNQQLALESLELVAGLEFRQAVYDYRTSIQQRDVSLAQYRFTQQALTVVEARYRVGSATFIELAQALAQTLSAAYDLVSAKYDMLLKYVTVRYYRGDVEGSVSLFDELQAP